MGDLNAIFAIDAKYGIGKNGTIPWPRNRPDLGFFSSATRGHCVIMGRRTWDDPLMPKPLEGRRNVVITHRPIDVEGVYCYDDIEKAVTWHLLQEQQVWVIGGVNLIMQFAGRYQNIYMTAFEGDFNCDTFINVDELIKDKYIKRILAVGTNHTRYGYERVY